MVVPDDFPFPWHPTYVWPGFNKSLDLPAQKPREVGIQVDIRPRERKPKNPVATPVAELQTAVPKPMRSYAVQTQPEEQEAPLEVVATLSDFANLTSGANGGFVLSTAKEMKDQAIQAGQSFFAQKYVSLLRPNRLAGMPGLGSASASRSSGGNPRSASIASLAKQTGSPENSAASHCHRRPANSSVNGGDSGTGAGDSATKRPRLEPPKDTLDVVLPEVKSETLEFEVEFPTFLEEGEDGKHGISVSE